MKPKKNNPQGVVKPPVYPGGKKALDEFIKSNLRYPDIAIDQKVQGTVSVDYDLDVFGNVTKTKIKHGIGYGCDEEALRLVKLLKYAKKKYQGMRVVFHQNINIHFRLPLPPPPPPAQTLNYQFVPAQPTKDTSPTITITITTEKS